MSGSRLGAYDVVRPIGTGGMGEVYLARDTKLGREVALKILPAEVAGDADRIARFEREARVLATLNHPGIAAIHGIEDSTDVRALVLEYVPGETLADRIAHGPVPIYQALEIARQIADALDAAHEKGIVHRDLKPANIKVDASGAVKVLDFGLAKALDSEPATDDHGLGPQGQTKSPTITGPAAMTHAGVVLGTAAYMSPEQARGKPVNKRADVWAFGCVLFEMLTGAQAFGGETISDAIASVLGKDPNWAALPAPTPASVRRLLARCLERDVKRRLHDIADARLDIEEAIAHPEAGSDPSVGVRSPSSKVTPALVGVVAVVSLLAGAVGAFLMMRSRVAAAPAPEVVRFTVTLPPGFTPSPFPPAAILSPDGRSLAIVARDDGGRDFLFLRAAGGTALRMVRITGTGSNDRPFFSPDSRWMAFLEPAGRGLVKMPVDGGVPVTIASLTPLNPSNFWGADWGSDGVIVFSQRAQTSNLIGLFRVPASGGTPAPLLMPDAARGETGYGWPQALPDGEHVLFSVRRESGQAGAVALLSMRTGQKRVVIEDAAYGRIASTGHLLFVRGGNLLAAPFDQNRLEIAGEPIRVQQGIGNEPFTGGADFTLAAAGTAAMVTGRPAELGTLRFVWVDRQGRVAPTAAPDRGFRQPRLSPDGQRVLVDIEGVNRDVWLYDFRRNLMSRLTTAEEEDEAPIWSPDGLRVAWAGSRNGRRYLLMRRADASDSEQRIWSSDDHFHVNAWVPGGTLLLNTRHGQLEGLTELTLEPEVRVRPFLESKFNQYGAAISPDGRRVAFVSDESGEGQVYLTTRHGAGRVQVSSKGGAEPLWSRNGRELFYRSGSRLMSVDVPSGDSLDVGNSRVLVEGPYIATARDPAYSVSPDGQRFLMLQPAATNAAGAEIVVTLNWLEELKRLAPIAKH